MDETKEMKDMKDALAQAVFGKGHSRTEALAKKVCVKCNRPATKFKDALSAKEFGISGLCQGCQDEFFGADDCEDMCEDPRTTPNG